VCEKEKRKVVHHSGGEKRCKMKADVIILRAAIIVENKRK